MSDFRDLLSRFNNLEPARVRAAWAALVAFATAVGVTVSADVDGKVSAGIAAFFAILAIVQGESTRAKVTPDFKLEQAAIEADMIAEIDRLNGVEGGE
jgi:hypothetical protein